MNPKGFGFGVVRKPAKKRCNMCCIESANNMGAGFAPFILLLKPRRIGRGAVSYKTGVPKGWRGRLLFLRFS